MPLWFEGAEIRVRLLYFLCVLLVISAIISAFSTPIIGFILCFGTLLVAGCGAAGAKFNSHKLLFYFMAGLACLIILSFISIIYLAITKPGWSYWMIKDIIIIALYGSGIFLSFLLRGRSLRPNPAQTGSFQKL